MNEKQQIKDTYDIRLTLLGTGGPTPVMERFGPSILVEAGVEKLLIDSGRGAIQRPMQLKQPVREVRTIFLTHLHSDHIVGLPDLWLTGWLNGRPETPLRVWGPRGTRDMMKYLDLAFNYDIRIRSFDDRLPPEGAVVLAEDIEEGVIYENNGVKVTTFEVDHAPIKPAFGYRIDYIGRSAAVCGDTRFSEHIIENVQDVDVLVHEVIAPDLMRGRGSSNSEAMERVIEHHTIPEKAGEVFARANPRLAVYSHIIPVTATAYDIIPPTRKTYSGPLEIGEDLMIIDIGDEVVVRRVND
jgi:ribonuclease Z